MIDGGNSYYIDDIRRAKELSAKGIHYVDVGTSGGVWGLDRGYCMMIGGETEVVERLDPIFSTLAPGPGDLSGNYAGAQGSASVGVGVGGNALIGGSNNSIALQPLSVQGQVGLNVAAGLESLELRPGR